MKFITDRRELAQEINIKGIPTIRMEIGHCMPGYEHCYEGSIVKVTSDKMEKRGSYPERCTARMYRDEAGNEDHDRPWTYKSISLMPESICLHSDFGYDDLMEMQKWSTARTIKAGDEVMVVFDDSEHKVCFCRKFKVGPVSEFVYPTAVLTPVDED